MFSQEIADLKRFNKSIYLCKSKVMACTQTMGRRARAHVGREHPFASHCIVMMKYKCYWNSSCVSNNLRHISNFFEFLFLFIDHVLTYTFRFHFKCWWDLLIVMSKANLAKILKKKYWCSWGWRKNGSDCWKGWDVHVHTMVKTLWGTHFDDVALNWDIEYFVIEKSINN